MTRPAVPSSVSSPASSLGSLPGSDRWPSSITIRDVGPRDGLQPEEPVSVDDRVRLIRSLVAAGLRHIEAVAFVSPKAVPAMAGAAEVLAAVRGEHAGTGVTWAGLVPNERGAEMALEASVDEVTVTISASETYNQRNVHMATGESEVVIGRIVSLAGATPVDAVVSCAFGSPYEADLATADAVALGSRLLDAGVTRVTYADTTGMATPRRVAELVAALPGGAPDVGLHLHDTRGTAVANAYAALGLGIARFDAAVGGLGGSPFAHGAGGNLATEELVALLDDLDVATGIDVERLCDAALQVEELVGRPVPSGVAHAGPRTRPAAPS